MIELRLESWAAIAPGLSTHKDWQDWCISQSQPNAPLDNQLLASVPPMLRRRLSLLGKCATASALTLLNADDKLPCVFASRHGDTALTLSLLEAIGKEEPMSPTKFSLAVHNAISGLFSIARNDTSPMTSIAATEGLVVNSLIESVAQLQNAERVLCVIYDAPLPTLYSSYCDSEHFPYAIALILNREKGTRFTLKSRVGNFPDKPLTNKNLNSEGLDLIRLLLGECVTVTSCIRDVSWHLTRQSE